MKRRLATAFFVLLPVTLPACGKSMKNPDIKVNPNPKMRYAITLTIEESPGPFDSVNGSAGYEVTNGACVPLTKFSGATVIPNKNVPMSLTSVGATAYKGDVFVDLLTDEDYFGQGLCRWSMRFVDFDLQIGNLAFAHSISLEDVLAGKSVTRYFNRLSYVSEDAKSPKSDHPRVNSGNPNRADFTDPKNTFSITITAKENFQ
ncbi:hypothetical protein GN316_16635 [Xylophilus sp. Kf1]|nr:hypothetical protein [Xylophilus sp. Kf1]